MARAKNTQRAAARRRYRQDIRPNTLADDAYTDDDDPAEDQDAAAAQPAPPARTGILGSFSRPDVRGDLRALPGLLRTQKRLWIPFVLLLIAFAIAAAFTQNLLPAGSDTIVALVLTLALQPSSLFVPFIAGFLAPRGAYLFGFLVGVLQASLYLILIAMSLTLTSTTGTAQEIQAPADPVSLVVSIYLTSIVFGTLAAAFASWYRRFLRQSQERAAANRALRDQQNAVKRKEDERKARIAERDARRPGSTKKTTP